MSRRPINVFVCEVCHHTGQTIRKSRHHIVPRWVTHDSRQVNLVDICRLCHNRIEEVYDHITTFLLPDESEFFKQKSRDLQFAKRLRIQVDKQLDTQLDLPDDAPPPESLIDPELIIHFELDHIPSLVETGVMVHEQQRLHHAAQDDLRQAMLRLDWHRIYHAAKLVVQGKLHLDRALKHLASEHLAG